MCAPITSSQSMDTRFRSANCDRHSQGRSLSGPSWRQFSGERPTTMLPGALEGSPGERRIPPAANAPQGKSQETWAVVGGGFLGMTLALRLAQQGKTLTLFEAAPFLGG